MTVEFFRFVFSIFVVYGHTYCLFFMNNPEVKEVSIHNSSVDYFFVLSGFLLAAHFKNDFSSKLFSMDGYIKYNVTRLSRLFSLCLISAVLDVITDLILVGKVKIKAWGTLFLLGGINNFDVFGLAWYISVLFWCGLLLSYVLSSFKKNAVFFILPMLFFVSISFLKGTYNANLSGSFPLVGGWFSSGIVRGICSMSAGMIAYYIHLLVKENIFKVKNWFVNFTVILFEIIFVLYISYLLFRAKSFSELVFLNYFIFPMLIITCFINRSVIFKFFDKEIFSYLGVVSTYIYVSHLPILRILKEKTSLGNKSQIFVYFVAIVSSIVVGFLVYHLYIWLEKKIKRLIVKDIN